MTSAERPGFGWACAAAALGVAYAAMSAYWALGGTALLDTVGGVLEREGREGNTALLAVVWLSVLLKLAAAGLGLAATVARTPPRVVVWLAWSAAVVLVVYGGVLTLVGLLVQADVVSASADADQKALRWHTFVWDPWFLLWGLLLAVALWRSRTRPRSPSEL